MPYKNNHIEDLFQKAAADYPLRTDNLNWDNVAVRLDNTVMNSVVVKKNSNVLKYAAIILFLLGSSVILYKFQFNAGDITQKKQDLKQNSASRQQKSSVEAPEKVSALSKTNNTQVIVNAKTDFTLKHLSSFEKPDATSLSANNYSFNNDIQNPAKANITAKQPLFSDQVNNASSQNPKQDDATSTPLNENGIADAAHSQNVNNSATSGNSAKSVKRVIKLQSPPTKFYGSLYGGPEFSMVKFQHISKPGYKIGVALGYRINSRFEIEIGLEREHINYYTDGKYFDKTGLNVKDAISLENVNGSSKLTNVPLTVKYNYLVRNKSHFYAGVGADVILLTHNESYQYAISKNGNEADRSKNYSSVTRPKYFTGITASTGYETKLANWVSLRIEPYYQIPTCKLGVGKLPVTSFGINVGIVKDLK